MAKYGAHSFSIVEDGTPDVTTTLSVTQMSLPAGVSLTEDESGATYDSLIGLREVAPVMNVTTKSVAKALELFGLNGGCLGKTPLLIQDLIQYWEPKTSCGGTAGTNLSYTASAGYYRLGQLSASRGQDATVTLICDLLSSNGVLAPVVQAQSVTLPTAINTDTFVLGPPKVADITFNEATSVTIDFGVQLTAKEAGWGSIYPTDIGLLKVRPEIRIENADLDLLKAAGVPLDSKDAVHAETLIAFRKKENRGAFVADATTEHFSLTASGMFYFDTIANGSGAQQANNTLVLKTAKESTTAPIVFSFDEAYAGT